MSSDEHGKLEYLRKEVDQVDLAFLSELSEFISQRMKIVEKIGAYKRKAGLDIHDKKREEAVIIDRGDKGKSKGLSKEMVREIFKSIVTHARGRE